MKSKIIETIEFNKCKLVKIINECTEALGFIGDKNEFISTLRLNSTMYDEYEIDKANGIHSLLEYLDIDSDNSIFIPFAIDDMNDNVLVADGSIINNSEIDLGTITLYEDTTIGILIFKINGNYCFDLVEYNACVGRYDNIDDYGDLEELLIKFIKNL